MLMGRHTGDAHAYMEWLHVKRGDGRGYRGLDFPERYIEEIEIIDDVLTEEKKGQFRMTPQDRYAFERLRFKYELGLRLIYDISRDEGCGEWACQGIQRVKWDVTEQRWEIEDEESLPWRRIAFEGRLLAPRLYWSEDTSVIACIVNGEQGALRLGEAECETDAGRVYPVEIVETMLGTIDTTDSEQDRMAFARIMAIWANTMTCLAFVRGVPLDDAELVTRITQKA